MADQKQLARLPKVDHLLEHPALLDLRHEIARPLVLSAARQALDELRARLLDGEEIAPEDLAADAVASAAAGLARRLAAPSLKRVVNATGVVVHTNLGRSLLARRALERLIEINRTYSNLEYDLAAGTSGQPLCARGEPH